MSQPNWDQVLERLAISVMTARGEDPESVMAVLTALDALEPMLPATRAPLLAAAREALGALKDAPADSVMDRFTDAIGAVQDLISAAQAGDAPQEEPDGFVLPEWVDDEVLDDFVADQRIQWEAFDTDLEDLASGEDDAFPRLRGKVHTLKGEAGLLGLTEVEHVLHTLESCFDTPAWGLDLAFAARDWVADAIEAYGRRELPEEDVKPLLARLEAAAASGDVEAPPSEDAVPSADANPETKGETVSSSPDDPSLETEPPVAAKAAAKKPAAKKAAAKKPAAKKAPAKKPAAKKAPAKKPAAKAEPPKAEPAHAVPSASNVTWDEDDLEILVEFLTESDDGLTQADEILLSGGEAALLPDQVDHLFRVFHTIKGVAGFLELHAVSGLAHTTETLLDLARQTKVEISGDNLDIVFDATELMRALVAELRAAVTEGRAPRDNANLAPMIARIEAAIAGEPPPVDLPVAAAPAPKGPVAVATPAPAKASAPKETKSGAASHKATKIKEFLKIDLERVDNLVSLIGELVIVEAMLSNAPELKGSTSPWVRDQLSQMSKITRDLQDIGTRMRMVPVRGVFQKMSRMIRDLSRKGGKPTRVLLSGEGTEMDRSMVEQLGDPLVHMVRNAVDHGLENIDERLATGKPREGTIKLSAYHQGGSVIVEVSDDGRGLSREKILKKAIEKGIVKDDGSKMSDAEVYDLIFAPGFSTAAKVTEISGRGVGMDVVRRNIESVRGRVTISSTPGKGSTFTMVLPLTLAIIDGLLITCGRERYIIPTLSVVESLKPEQSMIFTVARSGELVNVRDQTFPLFRLDRLLQIPNAVQDPTDALVVIVESRGRRLGLLVDDVLYQQQVVIKSLGNQTLGTEFLSGAAILSDGRVGLILNTDELAGLAGGPKTTTNEPQRGSGQSAA